MPLIILDLDLNIGLYLRSIVKLLFGLGRFIGTFIFKRVLPVVSRIVILWSIDCRSVPTGLTSRWVSVLIF